MIRLRGGWRLKVSLKSEIESGLAARFGDAIALREKPAAEFVSTGLGEIDEMSGGLPRGAISELLGPASSGCTTLLLAALRGLRIEMKSLRLWTPTTRSIRFRRQAPMLIWISCFGFAAARTPGAR